MLLFETLALIAHSQQLARHELEMRRRAWLVMCGCIAIGPQRTIAVVRDGIWSGRSGEVVDRQARVVSIKLSDGARVDGIPEV